MVKQRVLILASILAGVGSAGVLGPIHKGAAAASPAAAPAHRTALLIATGKTPRKEPGDKPLRAPQNDVVLMALLLTGRFGFAPESIYILGLEPAAREELRRAGHFRFGPAQADKRAIAAGFGWLRNSVFNARDTVVWYYSGHGTQVLNRDRSSGETGDDEALVPDGPIAGARDLVLDDDLDAFFKSLPSRNVTVLADTCFSGGMLKTPPLDGSAQFPVEGVKSLPGSSGVEFGRLPRSRARSATWEEVRQADRSILAACLADEQACTNTWGRGGRAFSPFTLALCRDLWRKPGTITWKDLATTDRPLGLTPRISDLVAMLGGRDQTPIAFRASSMGPVFLASTPNYDPRTMIARFHAEHTPFPVGRLIAEGIPGMSARIPGSLPLPMSSRADRHRRASWFWTEWR